MVFSEPLVNPSFLTGKMKTMPFIKCNATATEKSTWGRLLSSNFLPHLWSDIRSTLECAASEINKVALIRDTVFACLI